MSPPSASDSGTVTIESVGKGELSTCVRGERAGVSAVAGAAMSLPASMVGAGSVISFWAARMHRALGGVGKKGNRRPWCSRGCKWLPLFGLGRPAESTQGARVGRVSKNRTTLPQPFQDAMGGVQCAAPQHCHHAEQGEERERVCASEGIQQQPQTSQHECRLSSSEGKKAKGAATRARKGASGGSRQGWLADGESGLRRLCQEAVGQWLAAAGSGRHGRHGRHERHGRACGRVWPWMVCWFAGLLVRWFGIESS